jgi:hypothetical protein
MLTVLTQTPAFVLGNRSEDDAPRIGPVDRRQRRHAPTRMHVVQALTSALVEGTEQRR